MYLPEIYGLHDDDDISETYIIIYQTQDAAIPFLEWGVLEIYKAYY